MLSGTGRCGTLHRGYHDHLVNCHHQRQCLNCLPSQRRLDSLKARAASFAISLGGSNGPLFSSVNPMATSEGANPAAQETAANPEAQAAAPAFKSLDPSASGEDILVIHKPEEFQKVKESHPDQLICLMCKALGCRPCKMFARKYQRVAAANKDSIFLEVTGDESTDLRKLMIQLGVRATPTFKFYSLGNCIHTHVGIDEAKLKSAIEKCQKIRSGELQVEEEKKE